MSADLCFGVSCRWENAQGVHLATVAFQSPVPTRPGRVGLSLVEGVEREGQEPARHAACALLEMGHVEFLHERLGALLGRQGDLVPASLARAACALVTRAVNLAAGDASDAAWGELGYELERIEKQLT